MLPSRFETPTIQILILSAPKSIKKKRKKDKKVKEHISITLQAGENATWSFTILFNIFIVQA